MVMVPRLNEMEGQWSNGHFIALISALNIHTAYLQGIFHSYCDNRGGRKRVNTRGSPCNDKEQQYDSGIDTERRGGTWDFLPS